MSEETATAEAEAATTTDEQAHEETVPYARLQAATKKAKAEAEARKALEKQVAELTARMEDREQSGMPELERMKKDLERVQKRADEAEAKAADADARLARTRKERWVTSAAQEQNFADPSDASAFVNLDDIEDERDAERAVKQLAKQKKHLLKAQDPQLPGRVLRDGQRTTEERPKGAIDPDSEANMLAQALGELTKNRWQSI